MPTLPDYLVGFESDLIARNRAPLTIKDYLKVARHFTSWLEDQGHSLVVAEITPNDIRNWMGALHAKLAPRTVAKYFRSLQQVFNFILGEGDSGLTASPMERVRAPTVPETPVPIFSDEDLKALWSACGGNDFEARRDLALMRLFYDSGARLAEITNLKVVDLDTRERTILVVVKGRHTRAKKFTPETARDLERYLRVRKDHPHHDSEYVFIGKRGRLQSQGVRRALERRADEAKVSGMNPHKFRHTCTHRLLKAGVHEGEVMRLMGWKSRSMLDRYAASAADDRAFASYDRLATEGKL